MLDYRYYQNFTTQEEFVETSLVGKPLLTTPQLNKGTAFTQEERIEFRLLGKLPAVVETLEQQSERAYRQYQAYEGNLKRNIYLNNLLDKNQVLFYHLVSSHLTEMMPTIYTPIVGSAVKSFSREFRQPRGLYIAYPDRQHIDQIFENRTNPEVDLIVVTDGERVLGIGDQGIGAMDIPVAKLMVYTLCGGINPCRTLPIFLDVGTNNPELLNDPFYLGWRHERLRGEQYDEFIDLFIQTIKRKFPKVFLHWEDFGRDNASRLYQKYRRQLSSFNDDIQGTGAVALGGLIAAIHGNNETWLQQRIAVLGGGSAGIGICNQIVDAIVRQENITPEAARERFWIVDRDGLLSTQQSLTHDQKPYARSDEHINSFHCNGKIGLFEVVDHIKPTILIGCSAVAGAFDETIVRTMAKHVRNPIIFPLSNPTEKAEATPKQLLEWTNGAVRIATGSPFEDVDFAGKKWHIPQCNNAFVFPGIGLGILAVKASELTDNMLWEATNALSEITREMHGQNGAVLPTLEDAPTISKHIAVAVARQAIKDGVATENVNADLTQLIESMFWLPHYAPLKKSK